MVNSALKVLVSKCIVKPVHSASYRVVLVETSRKNMRKWKGAPDPYVTNLLLIFLAKDLDGLKRSLYENIA